MPTARRVALVLAALLAACAAPSQHDEARFGVVRVAFPDWASVYQEAFRERLEPMGALGPTFVEADEAQADVVVRHWDSGPGCAHGAGSWAGGRDVQIDPACCQGTLALQAAFEHEIGHALGMHHICRRLPSEASDCVGPMGVAVMNPALTYDHPGDIGFDEAFVAGVSQVDWTDLDLAEFARVHSSR